MNDHPSVTGAECIHCGFCLETCPTYVLTGHEEESPRGRILLARALEEGRFVPDRAALKPLDHCLGCLACETACPSGVIYRDVLMRARATAAKSGHVRHPLERWLLVHVITHPSRLRGLVFLYRILRLRRVLSLLSRVYFLPRSFRERTVLAPIVETGETWPSIRTATGARAILLRGCAARVLMPITESAMARLLALAGYRVELRDEPRCCGALAHHAGLESESRRLAEGTLLEFSSDADTIVVPTAAGCGAHLRSLADLVPEKTPEAHALAARVRDLSQALLEAPHPLRFDTSRPAGTVVFQDPCHLRHAQGIVLEPRRLLEQTGATLLEAEDAELCCGSAGSYHLAAPELSAPLARKKCRSLLETGAQTVVTANPGCWTQLRAVWPERGPRVTTLARFLVERVVATPADDLPTAATLHDDSSSSNKKAS